VPRLSCLPASFLKLRWDASSFLLQAASTILFCFWELQGPKTQATLVQWYSWHVLSLLPAAKIALYNLQASYWWFMRRLPCNGVSRRLPIM
jgi:hypothetical protein